jgi:carbon-monoxide dehydrogenase large subunit
VSFIGTVQDITERRERQEEASLNAALGAAQYAEFPARREEARARGKLRGMALSCYIEACGLAPSQAAGSPGAGVGLWESVEVRVNPVGTIEVLTGCHSHGQGHETTFAQLVAERSGVPTDQVSVVHGDTEKVQFGMGTYGSRSGAVGRLGVKFPGPTRHFQTKWEAASLPVY